VQVEITSKVEVTVELLAQCFAGLDDDSQCRFFVEVARIASTWPGGGDSQWYYVGGHLRNCECSTPEAREMISQIHHYMQTSTHT
jgi:hypothetical protein